MTGVSYANGIDYCNAEKTIDNLYNNNDSQETSATKCLEVKCLLDNETFTSVCEADSFDFVDAELFCIRFSQN